MREGSCDGDISGGKNRGRAGCRQLAMELVLDGGVEANEFSCGSGNAFLTGVCSTGSAA
ncbi:hypothetical protein [Oryza sativa Japonica Group]|uniref:Uncharacterized protein n=1 Tax=Oryza sativa subsp. japonica TaxID=39947 RepID=Q5VNS5_ORYSJ|nr:hypothetical protein [Oryza sativa Japonica Group]